MLMVETTSTETTGFLTTFGSQVALYGISLTLFLALLAVILHLCKIWVTKHLSRGFKRALIGFSLFIVVIGAYEALYPAKILFCKSYRLEKYMWRQASNGQLEFMSTYHKVLTTYGYIYLMGEQFEKWLDYNTQVLTSPVSFDGDIEDISIYFVIGESYIRSHSQLYGYDKETTPFQMGEYNKGNLIPFTNIYSTSKRTSPAVKNMLNLHNISNGENIAHGEYFPLIFAKAGYKVNIYDHQKVDGTFCDATLLSFLYNSLLNSQCYSYISPIGGAEFDYDYLGKESTHLFDTHNKTLHIIHLSGQHFPFNKHLPKGKEYEIFTGADYTDRTEKWLTPNKRKEIADYDNVTRYNDLVINYLFTNLEDKNAIIIYFSDHGEEVYDYRDNIGRTSPPANDQEEHYIQALYHVPFWIWVSPGLNNSNPDICAKIARHIDRIGSTDDIGHTMLKLAGISTIYYKEERDILSPAYTTPLRLKTEEGLVIRP